MNHPNLNRLRGTAVLLGAAILALTAVACGDVEEKIEEQVAGDAAAELPPIIDAQVLTYLADSDVPGATVAVTVNGRLVLSKGYGVADLDAGTQMQPWHRSRIGSVSKLITTIAALQLVEQGELALEDHLYTADATPFWGADPTGPPGIIYTDAGVLANPEDYYQALAIGVADLSESPDLGEFIAPDEDGPPDPLPPYLTQGDYQANVELAFDWANQIQIRELLSHTTGLLRSGSIAKAADVFHDGNQELVTYPEAHQAVLMGTSGPPLLFEPGTKRRYSNHGFGLMGQVIAEVSGEPYEEFAYDGIFGPLGLTDVVPHGVSVGPLDVTPYSSSDGSPVENPYHVTGEPALSTSTGGWVATAQDLVRVACGIDDISNNLRLLDHDTVNTAWYPAATISQPMGWDSVKNGVLSKNGSTGQGGARVTKYLPGSVSDVEINVAVATNKQGAPPASLLNNIADAVADTSIPDDVDLFTDHRCYVPPGEGLANPQPSASTAKPTRSPGLANPAPSRPADPVPPPPVQSSPPPARPAPPEVGDPGVRSSELWTLPAECGKPVETMVRASVATDAGLRSVDLRWSTGRGEDQQGSVEMAETGTGFWSATLGPLNPKVFPADHPLFDPIPLTVTVVATDEHGQTGSAKTELRLYRCIPPAG